MTSLRPRLFRTLVASIVLAAGAPAATLARDPIPVDAPGDCASATPIPTNRTWTTDDLLAAGDEDWFRFDLAASRWILATLGDLAVDARLELYADCATPLSSSDRSGTQYEELYQALPAGTYHLRVTANGGATSADPYAIRVRRLAEAVRIVSHSGWEPTPSQPRIVGEILNNTSLARQDVRVRIRLFDAADNLLATRFATALRERMRPRVRSIFLWDGEAIPSFHHYTVRIVKRPLAAAPPLRGLRAHPAGTVPDGSGGLSYVGTIENKRPFAVEEPRAMVTVYDALGNVQNVGYQDTLPDPLAAGASNAYAIHLTDRAEGNRVLTVAHGYRD
jgi:hypothetical protein